jgi:hypothetical protein
MSSSTLYRASGLALLVGTALFIIGSLLSFAYAPVTPLWVVMTGVWISGLAVVLLGMPGIVARQTTHAGRLGLAGFILLFLGWFLLTGFYIVDDLIMASWLDALAPHVYSQWFVNPAASTAVHVGFSMVGVGGVLLGVATVRAGVFPRWAGFLLIAGGLFGIGSLLAGSVTPVAVALTILGLGSMAPALWAAPGTVGIVVQPASAT